MAALQEAEAMIDDIIAADDVDETLRQEAQDVKAHMIHSRLYYQWLNSISDAIKSGAIFDYFPIPDKDA
ncbi:hypothetical protein [Staphylococcus rostri]|uniref:hypothetical protein n=1 Tax=Staphylococcus rostri TaxID=522262 RepID=UPI003F6576EB